MSKHKTPTAPRLLWDGIAAVLIGLLVRSLSEQTMETFISKLCDVLLSEEQP